MTKYLYISIIVVICLLASTLFYQYVKIKDLNVKYITEANNYKASIDNSIKLKLTIDQLELQNDSISKKIDSVILSNKIKSKTISSVSYIKQKVSKKDTLIISDTIFVKNLNLDTVIVDKWSRIKIVLKYPSIIALEQQFTNEQYIVSSVKKETVKPKKIWPLCIFQKKQLIERVSIFNSNPYVTNKEQRYINIIK